MITGLAQPLYWITNSITIVIREMPSAVDSISAPSSDFSRLPPASTL